MKVKEITASFGGTINTGNYENVRIDLSVTFEVEEHNSTDAEILAPQVFAVVRGMVRDEVERLEGVSRKWLRDTSTKTEDKLAF